jgi:maleate cis-trans isomerase
MNYYSCGVLVPWVNTAVENELRYLPRRVRYTVGRLRPSILPKDSHDESYLQSMFARATYAPNQFGWLTFDAIYLACTSVTWTTCVKAKSGTLLKTTYGCLINELRSLNVPEINLVAPYSQNMLDSLCEALKRDNVQVIRALPLRFGCEIKNIAPREIIDQCGSANLLSKERQLVLACTAIESRKLISHFARMGIACITSNSALINTIRREAFLKPKILSK